MPPSKTRLERINEQINDIKDKIRAFQINNNVTVKEQRQRQKSPCRKVVHINNMLLRARKALDLPPDSRLHHPQLDVIIGECLYSPLNYPPAMTYPKSSTKVKCRGILY